MKIFHVTVHMGGGIGRALSDTLVAEKKNSTALHRIYCLEKPENLQYVNRCLQDGIEIRVLPISKELFSELSKGDLLIIHWWNHPLTASFLLQFPNMKTRILFWIHVSGCTYPHLPFSLIEHMDITLFTTPCSFHNPLWTPAQQKTALEKGMVVYGLGEVQNIAKKQNYELGTKFIIGYIGTIQESKIHPRIADYCMEALRQIPSVHFVFAGKNELGKGIMEELESQGLLKHMTFTGYRQDIAALLPQFDIFGYPLNPYHYGSTENALLEAMSAGLPAVALDNPAEKCIINSGNNGFLASSPAEYGACVKTLYDSCQLRTRIGTAAFHYIRDTFSIERNLKRFQEALQKAIRLPPRYYEFADIFGSSPIEYFLSCTGRERKFFENALIGKQTAEDAIYIPEIYKCHSKSSISHFAKYFPKEPFSIFNSFGEKRLHG